MAMIYYPRYERFPGIGAQISLISTLLDTKQSIEIRHPFVDATFRDLLRIFNVGKDKINYVVDTTAPLDNDYLQRLNDFSKFFSPYVTDNSVNVLGQQVSLHANRIKKRYIAVCYANADSSLPPGKNLTSDPPFNRYHDREFWAKVIDLIVAAGYEVITINTLTTSLDDKIYQLVKFCDAVIAYEGGIAHLAHCLKIPTIMVPWRVYPSSENPVDHELRIFLQALHVDARTWFLHDHTEILKYSVDDLCKKIDSLYRGEGNNFFLDKKCSINENNFSLEILDPPKILEAERFTRFEWEFISKYIINE